MVTRVSGHVLSDRVGRTSTRGVALAQMIDASSDLRLARMLRVSICMGPNLATADCARPGCFSSTASFFTHELQFAPVRVENLGRILALLPRPIVVKSIEATTNFCVFPEFW